MIVILLYVSNILCKFCGIEKINSDFYSKNMCFICRTNRNRITAKIARRKYVINHKDKAKAADKNYRDNNKDKRKVYDKIYSEKNKGKRFAQVKANHYRRMKEDIIYRLRNLAAVSIGRHIKKCNSCKDYKSVVKYFPYTLQELKEHIEKQFEPWMTWENRGRYNSKTWDDNDPTTWTWQLDHIFPHSTFKYTSMEDQAFKDCWALSNLRPLSAKQNHTDGVKRLRHKKEK